MLEVLKKEVSNTTRALFLASVFAILLNVARVGLSQKINFIFLIWNLFLAWIPYMLATTLHSETSTKKFIAIFIPWLLFFPNAAYLVTDILHVDNRPPIPLWYDSLIFFIFAWLGIMLAAVALLRVHTYLENKYGQIKSAISVILVSFVSAFGIYLGRFERWNSWDALFNPLEVFHNSINIWRSIPHTSEPLYFTLVFAGTILCTYYVIKEVLKDK